MNYPRLYHETERLPRFEHYYMHVRLSALGFREETISTKKFIKGWKFIKEVS